jgi:hypothetical protein
MGGRRKAGHRADGYARLSSKVCGEANPATLRLSCDGEEIYFRSACAYTAKKSL